MRELHGQQRIEKEPEEDQFPNSSEGSPFRAPNSVELPPASPDSGELALQNEREPASVSEEYTPPTQESALEEIRTMFGGEMSEWSVEFSDNVGQMEFDATTGHLFVPRTQHDVTKGVHETGTAEEIAYHERMRGALQEGPRSEHIGKHVEQKGDKEVWHISKMWVTADGKIAMYGFTRDVPVSAERVANDGELDEEGDGTVVDLSTQGIELNLTPIWQESLEHHDVSGVIATGVELSLPENGNLETTEEQNSWFDRMFAAPEESHVFETEKFEQPFLGEVSPIMLPKEIFTTPSLEQEGVDEAASVEENHELIPQILELGDVARQVHAPRSEVIQHVYETEGELLGITLEKEGQSFEISEGVPVFLEVQTPEDPSFQTKEIKVSSGIELETYDVSRGLVGESEMSSFSHYVDVAPILRDDIEKSASSSEEGENSLHIKKMTVGERENFAPESIVVADTSFEETFSFHEKGDTEVVERDERVTDFKRESNTATPTPEAITLIFDTEVFPMVEVDNSSASIESTPFSVTETTVSERKENLVAEEETFAETAQAVWQETGIGLVEQAITDTDIESVAPVSLPTTLSGVLGVGKETYLPIVDDVSGIAIVEKESGQVQDYENNSEGVFVMEEVFVAQVVEATEKDIVEKAQVIPVTKMVEFSETPSLEDVGIVEIVNNTDKERTATSEPAVLFSPSVSLRQETVVKEVVVAEKNIDQLDTNHTVPEKTTSEGVSLKFETTEKIGLERKETPDQKGFEERTYVRDVAKQTDGATLKPEMVPQGKEKIGEEFKKEITARTRGQVESLLGRVRGYNPSELEEVIEGNVRSILQHSVPQTPIAIAA